MKACRQRPEEAFHKTVAQYLNWALEPDTAWTTIPAGGGGKIRGAGLKAMGYRKGWPDIEIVHLGRVYFLELKTPKTGLSPDQKACHADLLTAGAYVAVCRRVEEVEGTLRGWGLPLRATTGRALPAEGEAA